MKFLTGHRFWLHFPIGVACALLMSAGLFIPYLVVFIWGIVASTILALGFMIYEKWQENWKKDKASRDIRGAVCGFGVTTIIIMGWMFVASLMRL